MHLTLALATSLCLAAPQDEPAPGDWTSLALPSLCQDRPAGLPASLVADGKHVHLQDVFDRPRSESVVPLPATMLLQALEAQARANGEKLTFLPGTPPLVARGSDAAIRAARAQLAELERAAGRMDIVVTAHLAPVGLDAASPPEDAQRFEARVRSGDSVTFGERKKTPFLSSYDIEVSADAGIADPLVGAVLTGQSLELEAFRVEGGERIFLRGVLDLASLAEMHEFDPDTQDLGLFQQPEVRSAQVAFSSVSAPGEAVVVRLAGTRLESPDWSLWITATTERDATDGTGLGVLDLGFLATSSPGLPAFELENEDRFRGANGVEPFPALPPSAIASSVEDRRGAAGLYPAASLLLADLSRPDLVQRARGLIAAYEGPRLESAELSLVRGSLRVALPTTAFAPARVVVGTERTFVLDYEAEIAPESWMPAPRVERLFDGLVVDASLFAGRLSVAALATTLDAGGEAVDAGRLGRFQVPRTSRSSARRGLDGSAPSATLFRGSGTGSELSLEFLVP